MADGSRVKAILVTARFLEGIIKEHTPLRAVIAKGLPDDAKIVGMYIDSERARILVLHVWSSEFPEVPDVTPLERIPLTDYSIFWPEEITEQMEAFLRKEGIEYKGLPYATL